MPISERCSKRNHWYSQSNKAIFLRIDKLRLALQMETKREPFSSLQGTCRTENLKL
jgi:hypothetical protein